VKKGREELAGLDNGVLEQQVSECNGTKVNEVSADSSLAVAQEAGSTSTRYSQSDQFLFCPQALSSKTGRGTRELMKKLKTDRQQREPKRMTTLRREEAETIAVL